MAVEGCLTEVLCNHSCGGSRGHGGYVGYIYMGSSTDQGFVLGETIKIKWPIIN